ncbi:hypothetical protein AVEN_45065-1 [Araneus ventricosus]|uniref:DUF4817 domain-containing protein n=1 Tax=Araneus ventricosus TaxID=182803 RepID=A0A4Y2RPF8_ARAVE|nr:hypothetical protein AVEN_45065-1 [Araneus ventricosus]
MYSIEQCVFLVLEYHRLERSPTLTRRSFQKRFSVRKGPDAKTIRKLFSQFERRSSVDDNRMGNAGPRLTAVTSENVVEVSGIVQQNPRNTDRRIASETGLKRSSSQKILRNSLRMFPYKIQSYKAIPIKAMRQRSDFANEILTIIDNERFDVGCIWFTDEAHFHLNGCDRPRIEWFIQDGARPHRTEKVFRFLDQYFGNRVIALHYPKCTGIVMDCPPYSPDLTPFDYLLWGALKDTVYGNPPSTLDELESPICVAFNSIYVKTLKGDWSFGSCTVNRTRYESLLRNQLIPALQQRGCVESTIFMQVSVPPHTSEAAAESAFWKLKNYLSPFPNSVDTTITRPERLRLLVVGLARRGSDYELS